VSALLTLLGSVPDPWARRGMRHSLAQLLAVGLSAVIAGAGWFAAILKLRSVNGDWTDYWTYHLT